MPKGDLKYLEGGKKSSDEEIRAGLRHLNEKEKLEAMKQILGLMSMGKDTSDLFPDVVMNVVCTSLELKKLVYTYLLRYAAEKSDVALLSINTFQKDMEHSNQLIRALALRVLSGLGVPVINQLVLLAIKKATSDPSPYVRKTAAYAIPKLYRMDPEQLPALLEILQTLLNDRLVLVLSGAIATFNEVCPNNLELLHPFFRKLCHMLVDMDEWGQITLLNLLLRYGRTQFLNPVKPKKEKPADGLDDLDGKKKKKRKKKSFYSDDESEEFSDDEEWELMMDEDHKLLLKCAQPLLQSRNSGVVMAVAALYWHLADENESAKVARPLVRLLRGHREVQAVVLSNIATWCCSRPELFRPYLYDFLVKGDDGKMQRELKLDILVHIVDQDNITAVLKEFQTYVKHPDKKFVALTIQSLGRCAAQMESVAETCLRYLMILVRSKTDAVVSESIVSIRHLLQHHENFVADGVTAMTHHLSLITVPRARASIAWVIGEFIDRVPTFGPDALRILLKDFASEELEVRMQALNLGCKVYLNNKEQSEALVQYLFELCKYDTSYDLRDRARLLKAALMGQDSMVDVAIPLLRSMKPPPMVTSVMKDRQRYATGSLSQLVNHTAMGYIPLADFPAERPDPSVRDAPVTSYGMKPKKKKSKKDKTHKKKRDDLDSFYNDESSEESDEESSSGESSSEESDEESSEDYEARKGFYDSVTSESSEDESSEEESSEDESSSEDEDDPEQGSESSSETSSSDEAGVTSKPFLQAVNDSADDLLGGMSQGAPAEQTSLLQSSDDTSSDDDLLGPIGATAAKPSSSALPDLGDIFGDAPAAENSSSGVLGLLQVQKTAMHVSSESALPRSQLLNHVTTRGLGVDYQFVRTMQSSDVNVIRLFMKNHSSMTIQSIKVSKPVEGGGLSMVPFNPIPSLSPGATTEVTVNINFNNKTQPARFEISDCNGEHKAALQPKVGELFYPHQMDMEEFRATQAKLQGMNKTCGTATAHKELSVVDLISAFAHLAFIGEEDNSYLFSGKTVSGGRPMLLVVERTEEHNYKYDIHLENAILGSGFSAELKKEIAG